MHYVLTIILFNIPYKYSLIFQDLTRLRSKVRRQFDSIQNLLRSDAISQTDRDKFVLYYLFFSQIREVFESLLQEK